ncbi:MAG: right-handed parallel beta-helix repeat-containing protein [Bacteroidetes bacterium]|nr:right-handed parallel beta-helix repeat-containing protein [Bacteroidota bacterium]
MKHFLPFVLFLLLAPSIFANTYHVSPAGSNGNDGLTPATAFLTLQKASDVVQPGDSVSVLPGTYAGFYHIKSGTPSQRIIFAALPGVLINLRNATTTDGINLEGASYVTIEGFKVYGVARAGFRAVSDTGIIFRNNIADSCGKWGILTGFSENILIEFNECSRSIAEHGIYFGNSADNPIIRNNICWGNNAAGIHMNADFNLQPGDGIISNALVENNVIFNNGQAGGSGINCDGVQSSRIQNNLLYNNNASGISLYRIDAAEGAKNNVVVNNTILQSMYARWALNISDSSSGNIVFNNIFYSPHNFRGSISIDAASLAGFHSDYNVLVDRMSNNGGSTNMTFAQWKSTTNNDLNSLLSVPTLLFADSAVNDYHLSPSSLAIDLGRASLAGAFVPSTDIENNARSQGSNPDAGAFEFPMITALNELNSKTISWSTVLAEEVVSIYDLSGKMVFSGKKRGILSGDLGRALYVFKLEMKNTSSMRMGWLIEL